MNEVEQLTSEQCKLGFAIANLGTFQALKKAGELKLSLLEYIDKSKDPNFHQICPCLFLLTLEELKNGIEQLQTRGRLVEPIYKDLIDNLLTTQEKPPLSDQNLVQSQQFLERGNTKMFDESFETYCYTCNHYPCTCVSKNEVFDKSYAIINDSPYNKKKSCSCKFLCKCLTSRPANILFGVAGVGASTGVLVANNAIIAAMLTALGPTLWIPAVITTASVLLALSPFLIARGLMHEPDYLKEDSHWSNSKAITFFREKPLALSGAMIAAVGVSVAITSKAIIASLIAAGIAAAVATPAVFIAAGVLAAIGLMLIAAAVIAQRKENEMYAPTRYNPETYDNQEDYNGRYGAAL